VGWYGPPQGNGLILFAWASGTEAVATGAPPRAARRAISMTVAGGASEVQRDVIATQALGLPRST
jgi:hypothetical protein